MKSQNNSTDMISTDGRVAQYVRMERLRFTHSQKIDSSQITDYDDTQCKVIEYPLIAAYGQAAFHFNMSIRQNYYENKNFNYIEFVNLYAQNNPGYVLPEESTCKFILKRSGLRDLECSIKGKLYYRYMKDPISVFEIPEDHAIFKLFGSFIQNPKEIAPVLVLELELPKKCFFARNWPRYLDSLPLGWENDKRYKVLTVEDKHNLHIICKDGVLYTKKRDLIRKSNNFKEKFKNEWKDKAEIKLDITLEMMRIFVIFWQTNTFLPPKKLTPEFLTDIVNMGVREFRVKFDNWQDFWYDLDAYVCSEIEVTSLSLYDLLSWWKPSFVLRLRELIEWTIVKNYYTEVTTEYKQDAKFKDKKKTEIHKLLHSLWNKFEEETPFERLLKVHKMTQNIVVAEIMDQKCNKQCLK